MDSFDSEDIFEFKPLTEGLGFHKKAETNKTTSTTPKAASPSSLGSELYTPASRAEKESAKKSYALSLDTDADLMSSAGESMPSTSISDLIASLPPSLDFVGEKQGSDLSSANDSRPQIFQPLAREDYKPEYKMPIPSSSTGPTIGQVLPGAGMKLSHSPSAAVLPVPMLRPPQSTLSTNATATIPASPYRERLDESFARAFPHAEKKTATMATTKTKAARPAAKVEAGLEAVPASLGAGVLDAMVVCGMSTLLLVCILAITHVNLLGLLSNAQTDVPTRLHLVLLFVAVLQLYMLTARSFFSSTLGEWAFDLQLGSETDQKQTLYPIRVAWRTLVTTFTGLIVLPLASLVAKRDLGALISGTQLYRRTN